MSTSDATRTVGHSRKRGEVTTATSAAADEERTYRREREQAAAATSALALLTEALTEALPEAAVFEVSPAGRVMTWAEGAVRLYGYSAAEVVGAPATRTLARGRGPSAEFRHALDAARATRYSGRAWHARKDGSRFNAHVACAALRDPAGCVTGFAVLAQDLSQRERADQERARLAALVMDSQDAIYSKGLDGTILTWNPAAARLFGYAPEQIIGRSVALLIPPGRLAEERRMIARLRRGEHIEHYETVRLVKGGRLIDVSLSLSPMRGAAGRVAGASVILRDVTGRKRAEAALRESERRARAVLETATDAILTIDEAGVIDSANPATTRLFGYAPGEMVGRNVTMLMPEPYRSEHAEYLRSYLRTGQARIIGIGREVTAVRKDGSTFPIHLSVSEVPLGDRRLFTGIIHDLSGRRELERQIIEASTAEQRRIGQDLHDGLCQDLVGIAFQSDQIARELGALPATAPAAPEATVATVATVAPAAAALAARVEQVASSVREAVDHARRLSHGLNPVDLKGGGLPAALEALARKVSETYHIACTFDWDSQAQAADDAVATHLYRIAQEATGNAIRHGNARRVELSLALHGVAGLQLTVRDDGRGLAAPAPRGEPTGPAPGSTGAALSTGIGLRTMQYRAHVIGGVFDIRPHPRCGTVVTCTVSDAGLRSPRADRDAARIARGRRRGGNVPK